MFRLCGEEDINYRRKNSFNLVCGCVVGLLASAFLRSEKIFVVNFLLRGRRENLILPVKIFFNLGMIGAFFCILWYFLKMKNRKITTYHLWSILISATVLVGSLLLVVMALRKWILERVISGFWDTLPGLFIITNLPYLLLLYMAAVFSGVFSCLTRGRVKYIQYISTEIKGMESDGVGRQLEIIGNEEIADLCRSINQMSQKLFEKEQSEKEMERRKDELITNVSHDLRSPLTSIIGYVQLLKKDPTDTEKFREYIEVVDLRLQGLNKMVNELFELTKLNGTDIAMNFERVDIVALLEHLAWENKILLQERGISLVTEIEDTPFEMEVDVGKMVRALQNLFDNARKYAKENSNVILCAAYKKDVFEIQMENKMANAEDFQEKKLFERFYKGDFSRSDMGSSGLGLAIIKRIIELHEGEIHARVEGEWMKFCIKFNKGKF